MKASKLLFGALLLTIPVLATALVLCWKPWIPSGEMTDRQSVALTNAVRLVSSEPIFKIGFADWDNTAFVEMGVTNYYGEVVKYGYVFKRTLFGWKFMTESPHGGLQHYLTFLQEIRKETKIYSMLAVGTPFPSFVATDMNGSSLSPASFRSKVLLVDFWATWCVPCRAEVPNVVATFQKYHDRGFDVIGVSLDTDRRKLLDFTRQNNMTWPECFDADGERLAEKYGIIDNKGIPSDFLVDTNGTIIGKGLRGGALRKAVARAFAK